MLNKQEQEHFDKLTNHMMNSEVQHVSIEEEREYEKRMKRREDSKVKARVPVKINKVEREVWEIKQEEELKEGQMFSNDLDYNLSK